MNKYLILFLIIFVSITFGIVEGYLLNNGEILLFGLMFISVLSTIGFKDWK